MGPFNNREIATAFWLLAFMTWALREGAVRTSLAGVLRAFCNPKILAAVCLMLLYAATSVALLAAVGLWEIALLKDTIMWFSASALAMMMRFATSDDVENIFQGILVDSVKIVIFLEFLVNTYTFSLLAELIIVPVLTLIAMADAVVNFDKKYSVVAGLTKRVQIVIGFLILAIALSRAISDLQNLYNLETVRSIALAPLLSLLLSPFLYVMVLISKYELVFLRLDLGIEKESGLKRYARRRILMHVGLSLKRVQHLLKSHAADLMRVQKEAHVDHLLE